MFELIRVLCRNHGLVRNSLEKWTRFDEPAQIHCVLSRWPHHGIHPVSIRMVDSAVPFTSKLPDSVMAIGDATSPGEDRAIKLLAHIVVSEVPVRWVPDRPRINRMVLIVWLQINHRLRWLDVVIPVDQLPRRCISPASVAALNTVDRKPPCIA